MDTRNLNFFRIKLFSKIEKLKGKSQIQQLKANDLVEFFKWAKKNPQWFGTDFSLWKQKQKSTYKNTKRKTNCCVFLYIFPLFHNECKVYGEKTEVFFFEKTRDFGEKTQLN